MQVTVDELVLLIGKQAIELDRLRVECESLRRAVAIERARADNAEKLVDTLRAAGDGGGA
jgi:hypothetical protein